MTGTTPRIGLRQAYRLCSMPHSERISVISQGLPIILDSAQGFWKAGCRLKEAPREAQVMEGLATEEAAKILILMDLVRCPSKLAASKLGKIVGCFYSHLARLIYADAVSWRPVDIAELRRYVDGHRKSFYLEGSIGEYIFPNPTLYDRESRLYADIEAFEDDRIIWNAPTRCSGRLSSLGSTVLSLTEAMSQLGLFKLNGLKAVSEIWGDVNFSDEEDHATSRELTQILLERLIKERLLEDTSSQDQADTLFEYWQMPMYNLEFSTISVSSEVLGAEQESKLWAEMGGM